MVSSSKFATEFGLLTVIFNLSEVEIILAHLHYCADNFSGF